MLPPSPSLKEHGKLRLVLLVPRPVDSGWLAGETVNGMLEVAVTTSDLSLGEIGVELSGFEELRSRDHTSTRRLLSARVDFQGGSLPPSNAVLPEADSQTRQPGYFRARRGKTRFPFSFKLPRDLPSSCSLGGNAATRYELRAFASSIFEGNVEIKSEKRALQVVERWGDWDAPHEEWHKGVEKKAAEKLKLGGDGQLVLALACGKDAWSETPLRLFWRADQGMGVQGKGTVELRARVRNSSKKPVSGLKVAISRRLRILYPKNEQPVVPPPSIAATVFHQAFNGEMFDFPPGEEKEVMLRFALPKDECWTKRHGVLFELDVFATVTVNCGLLAKDLTVELPIFVAHPASLPPAAHDHIGEQVLRAVPPALPSLPSFPRSPSTGPAYIDPYQHARSPTQQRVSFGPPRTGHSSASSSTVGFGDTRSLSSSPAPAPAHLHAMAPLPPPQPQAHAQYIAFDPSVPDMTQSHFLNSITHQQAQQVWVPPNSAMSISLSSPSSSIGFAPPPPMLSPPPPGAGEHLTSSPTSWASAFPQLSEPHIAPVEPYNAVHRARHDSAPPSVYQPMHASSMPLPPPPAASPVPLVRSHSASSLRSVTRVTPPPPPSPSSRFPPVLQASAQHLSVDPALLETIGEDGESQAGTAKSQNLDPSVLAALARCNESSADLPSPRGRPSIGSRSTSAQDLEELVAAEEEAHDAKQQDDERKKTQPSLQQPVSGSVRDLFALPTPASPSRATSRSPALMPPRTEGGLRALEARLSRPTTPEVSSVPLRSPTLVEDPRPLSPLATGSSASSSVSMTRRASAQEMTSDELRRAVDVARGRSGSSTSASGTSAVAAPHPSLPKESSEKVTQESAPVAVAQSAVTRSPAKKASSRPTFTSKRKPEPSPDAKEAADRFESTPALSSSAIDKSPALASLPKSPTLDTASGRKVVDVAETKELREDAANRVSIWLKDEPTFAATSISSSSSGTQKPLKRRTVDFTFARQAPLPPSSDGEATMVPPTKRGGSPRIAGARPVAVDAGAQARSDASSVSHKHTKSEPTKAQLLANESAHEDAAAVSAQAHAKEADRRFALKKDESGSRYAHKSARGGKGGAVTQIAQIWAGNSDEAVTRSDSVSPRLSPKVSKVATPAAESKSKPLAPVGNIQRDFSSPSANLSAPRIPTVKRLSDPSTARPFLNTTVGRPAVLSGAVRAQPSMMRASVSSPSISETSAVRKEGGSKAAAAGTEVAPGGSKVKELMARYKQQVEAQAR